MGGCWLGYVADSHDCTVPGAWDRLLNNYFFQLQGPHQPRANERVLDLAVWPMPYPDRWHPQKYLPIDR